MSSMAVVDLLKWTFSKKQKTKNLLASEDEPEVFFFEDLRQVSFAYFIHAHV